MEWCFDTVDGDLGVLRREIRRYVDRHAAPGTDVDGSELIVAELLANAAEHAPGLIWVTLDWSRLAPVLTVHDLGPSFDLEAAPLADPTSTSGRGLYIAAALAPDLRLAAKRSGGKKISATLPVTRPPEADHAPPRLRRRTLPLSVEADTQGFFGRESFLRALVVQIAETVDTQHGPAALDQTIAQVGTDVGGRMEDEYRSARALTENLTPEQLAEFYIGLKEAIGGDFYLIEMGPDRIVLGNRACPFGDVVQRAPSLCRMTSSVFGAAAARSGHEASVVLEERIAIGDPECRVVIWLVPPPAESVPVAHRYEPTTEAT